MYSTQIAFVIRGQHLQRSFMRDDSVGGGVDLQTWKESAYKGHNDPWQLSAPFNEILP